MQFETWQDHLHDYKNSKGIKPWIEDLAEERHLFKDFLMALWQEDIAISSNNKLVSILKKSEEPDAWLYAPQELLDQEIEVFPMEWHDQRLAIYQDIFKELYLNGNEKAVAKMKVFLAKVKVGVRMSFYEEMIRIHQDAFLLKMDLGILCLIRAEMNGRTDDLATLEKNCSNKIETCLISPSQYNCEPSLYCLPLLAYIWRKEDPEKLLRKCFELEYKWNRPPNPAILNHLKVYFRQAIQTLCENNQWDSLIEIKRYAHGWVKAMIENVQSHPSLEQCLEKIKVKELEHANSRMKEQSTKEYAKKLDEMVEE